MVDGHVDHHVAHSAVGNPVAAGPEDDHREPEDGVGEDRGQLGDVVRDAEGVDERDDRRQGGAVVDDGHPLHQAVAQAHDGQLASTVVRCVA